MMDRITSYINMITNELKIGIFRLENPSQRQLNVLRRLELVFTETFANETLIPLLIQTSPISLRALDWLVTNYSKKNNIVCSGKNNSLFNIYHGYKVALSHFRRRNFDPFRRRDRIYIQVNSKQYETTVGQCNFLHWAVTHGVFEYAIEHAVAIEQDMNVAAALHKIERKKKKANGIPHRRTELSCAPMTKCSVYNVETFVSFNMFTNKS